MLLITYSPVNINHKLSYFDIKHSVPSEIILTDSTCTTMFFKREGDEHPFRKQNTPPMINIFNTNIS